LSKTAIMFPGQGAQAVGMGRDLVEVSPLAREVYDQANRVLGQDLAALCFEGPAEQLNRTDFSQPAIFVTSVAFWRALEHDGTAAKLQPAAMAGLSLGEYTALHLAGAISFDDALRLVAQRGKLMQAAAETSKGGMVSLMGLDEPKAAELCARAVQTGETLIPANFNCPGQIVISGSKTACERAVQLADEFGARAVPLVVAGAFHSALMTPAAEGLANALAKTAISAPRIPVVSNVSGDYYADPEDIRTQLRRQVASPIRWQSAMERLLTDGFDRFVEVGPGKVLVGLLRKIARSAKSLNYSTAAALGQATP